MRRLVLLVFFIGQTGTWARAQPVAAGPLKALHDSRETHLANVRQLTSGGQNAEAYWSWDSKRLIFQSQRDGSTADAMYTMNADGTDVRRVSNGEGRTTCGYFLPGDRGILYSSTHGFSKDAPPPPDRSLGYVWPVYRRYAIYHAKPDGGEAVALFPKDVEPGKESSYNAEATVSPRGDRIIFTSTIDGDIDLYSMDLEGNDLKRITDKLGYDGGAFYSPDGSKIVWRANYPQSPQEIKDYQDLLDRQLVRPSKMELWIADADGSNAKQITNSGAASFAPFFTPDGRRILFSSNLDDPKRRKFELYLINIDGTGLERVTYGQEFDSFPMISPDGKMLVWASNRNGSEPRETNIFVADWVE